MTTDIYAIWDDEASDLEKATAVQALIDSGDVWSLEGSMGRAAMSAIEQGFNMVGPVARRDFWGNTVPGRDDLEPGSVGTYGYVLDHMGKDWADAMARRRQ